MILEFIVIILSFVGALASFFAMITDLQQASGINWRAVGGFIFFVFLFVTLIKPVKGKTPEQIKASWKYKDYQAVYDYLDTHKPNLSYEQEDRQSLAVLLFFDWVIEDDSNPDALVLNRITNTSNDTQIFQPKNKKSL